ncbi:bile acid:sodium symporter family protein [Nocardioides piscis]|nr:bile acid:sodium symporter family protein [Nocardioides piscis]
MDSALTEIGLPIALAIIMFGLGLDLTVADFKRIVREPKAAAIALACQIVLMPIICFGLVALFDLPPLLGIGMLLLAASPGGTTAAMFSRLFRGDVALNISLTAANTAIAIVTLPLITGLAISYYNDEITGGVSMPLAEVIKVFGLILIPVAIGMVVRSKSPEFAERMDKPVRIGSAVILAVLVLAILLGERDNITDYLADIGLVAALFCAVNLLIGYYLPKALGVTGPQAIASSMEVGVHNATLAIYVALQVLEVTDAQAVTISVPAAVYSLFMFAFAALWGTYVSRQVTAATTSNDKQTV